MFATKIKQVYTSYICDLDDILEMMYDLLYRKDVTATFKKLVWAKTVEEEFRLLVDSLDFAKKQFIFNFIKVFKDSNKDIVTDLIEVKKNIRYLEIQLEQKIKEIKKVASDISDRYNEFSILRQLDFSNFVMSLDYQSILKECQMLSKKQIKDPKIESYLRIKAKLS